MKTRDELLKIAQSLCEKCRHVLADHVHEFRAHSGKTPRDIPSYAKTLDETKTALDLRCDLQPDESRTVKIMVTHMLQQAMANLSDKEDSLGRPLTEQELEDWLRRG
jgi:hypothetical protein